MTYFRSGAISKRFQVRIMMYKQPATCIKYLHETIKKTNTRPPTFIWKELCTKKCSDLSETMKDVERVYVVDGHLISTAEKPRKMPNSYIIQQQMVLSATRNGLLRRKVPAECDECFNKNACLRCDYNCYISKN